MIEHFARALYLFRVSAATFGSGTAARLKFADIALRFVRRIKILRTQTSVTSRWLYKTLSPYYVTTPPISPVGPLSLHNAHAPDL